MFFFFCFFLFSQARFINAFDGGRFACTTDFECSTSTYLSPSFRIILWGLAAGFANMFAE